MAKSSEYDNTMADLMFPCSSTKDDLGLPCGPTEGDPELRSDPAEETNSLSNKPSLASGCRYTCSASTAPDQRISTHEGPDPASLKPTGEVGDVNHTQVEEEEEEEELLLLRKCHLWFTQHVDNRIDETQCKVTADEYLTQYRETDFSSAMDSYRFIEKTRESISPYREAELIQLFKINGYAYHLQPDNLLITPFVKLPSRTQRSGRSTEPSSRPQQPRPSTRSSLYSRVAPDTHDVAESRIPTISPAAIAGNLLDLQFIPTSQFVNSHNACDAGPCESDSPLAPKAMYGFCLGRLYHERTGHSDSMQHTPFYVFLVTTQSDQTIWILSMFDMGQISTESYNFYDAYWDGEKRCSKLPPYPDPRCLNLSTKDLSSLPGFERFGGFTAIKVMEAEQLGYRRDETFQPSPKPETCVCNHYIVPYTIDDYAVQTLYS